jgi:hypothetical protein
MGYKSVLTKSEVAAAFAGGIGASLLMDLFIGMFGAAVVLAFYEQHKRKRSSLAATGKAPAVTETSGTGQPEQQ